MVPIRIVKRVNSSSRYAILQVGEPPQRIEMDLDMLSCDFYVMTTTSNKGTPFNVFGSKSFSA